MENLPTINSAVPSHVPQELIKEFNHMASPGMLPEPGGCPYKVMQTLHQGPDIFYSPAIGRMLEGNWVVTRYQTMKDILSDPETFSSRGIAGFSHLLGETWDMIPLEVDPPHNARFRQFLNPLFAPGRVEAMSKNIRSICVGLIEAIQAKGQCDFIEDFSRRFPVRIFMDLMGIPLSDYHTILDWEEKILHSPDIEERAVGAHEIRRYLVDLLQQRKAEPKDDLLSLIATETLGDAPMTDTEQLSMSLFLFVAGLDTVASALGYIFRYLASHPDEQQQLANDNTLIPRAVEELLRCHSVVITSRRVTRDVEIDGVLMKAGDSVSLPLGLANYDEQAFPDATQIKLDRTPNRHIAFTYGPHNCLGAQLARREIIIAIEEWTRRMPNFRLQPDNPPIARGGAVFGVDQMYLDWDQ